jgi:hypothetical protein
MLEYILQMGDIFMAVFNVNFSFSKKKEEIDFSKIEKEEKHWTKSSALSWIKKYSELEETVNILKRQAEYKVDRTINKKIENNKLFFKILMKNLLFFVFVQAYFLLRPTLMTLDNHLSLFFTMDGYHLLFESNYYFNLDTEVNIFWSIFVNLVVPFFLFFLYAKKTLSKFEQKISMESEMLMVFTTIKFIILSATFLITSLIVIFQGTIYSDIAVTFNIAFILLTVLVLSFSLVMPFEYIAYRKSKIKDNVWEKYNNLRYEKKKMKEELKNDDILSKMLYTHESSMSFNESCLYNKLFKENMDDLNIKEMQKIYFERKEIEEKNKLVIMTE